MPEQKPESPALADVASTLVGGGAGMALLMTVDWSQVPQGQSVKVAVAVLLILIGAWLYHGVRPPAADQPFKET